MSAGQVRACNDLCAEFVQCHSVQRFRALLGLLSCPVALLVFVLDALAVHPSVKLQLVAPSNSQNQTSIANQQQNVSSSLQPPAPPGLPAVAISDGGKTLFFVLMHSGTKQVLPLAQSASTCK